MGIVESILLLSFLFLAGVALFLLKTTGSIK